MSANDPSGTEPVEKLRARKLRALEKLTREVEDLTQLLKRLNFQDERQLTLPQTRGTPPKNPRKD